MKLLSRGFFHQCTDKDKLTNLLINNSSIKAYIGFDCTAPSLHVGSLYYKSCVLRLLQKYGHQPVVLLGWRNHTNR